MNRRALLLLPAVAAPAAAVGGAVYAAMNTQLTQVLGQLTRRDEELASLRDSSTKLRSQVTTLEERVSRLPQRWVASGGGTNLKFMPDAAGRPTVELPEVFSFDRNHAFCRVDTNPAPFVMPTYRMGNVPIPANGFFMSMTASTIDQFDARQTPEGKAMATLRGVLDCHTEVVTATVRVGSRTVSEPAGYEIVAIDGGVGGGQAGDTFAFTVFFDEQAAPLNHAIFGPKFTFTGDMVDGEITIQTLARLVP